MSLTYADKPTGGEEAGRVKGERMWDKDRRDELADLQQLLYAACSLNSGSDVIGKMQRIIETANKLMLSDINTPRDSFLQFLVMEALREGER